MAAYVKRPPKQRACQYAGCTNVFEVGYQQGPRRYCKECAPIARADLYRDRYTPKGFRVYPPRECTHCHAAFDPVNARQLYCDAPCRRQAQRAMRLNDILLRHDFRTRRAS